MFLIPHIFCLPIFLPHCLREDNRWRLLKFVSKVQAMNTIYLFFIKKVPYVTSQSISYIVFLMGNFLARINRQAHSSFLLKIGLNQKLSLNQSALNSNIKNSKTLDKFAGLRNQILS